MINVGVIGYGYWGPNLARVWSQSKKARLKYVCDLKDDRVSAAQLNCPQSICVKDYNVILNDPEVEAVNIATNIITHYEIAKNALLANKHVLVEKPLTASSEEALELIEIAKKVKRVLMVGHTFLYSPPVIKINNYLKCNHVGNIDFIQLSRINLGKVKHDFNVIWDLAPHDFSILEFWLNNMPEWVQVVGKAAVYQNVCDVAFISMQFPGEILVNMHLSWLSPVKLRQSYIVGDKNMIVYDDTHPSEKVRVYDMGIDLIKEPDTFGEFQLTYRSGDISVPRLDNTEPLAAECDHFIDCIKNNQQPRTDSQHALRIIRMIEAAQQSLKNKGERVYFEK